MRSRYLLELTTPEMEAYFARGGKTAFLPVGSVEMHGPHQPIGTDSLIARAFALRLAEATDGVVLPDVYYTWAGSTDGFAGTISVEPSLVQQLVETIALRAARMGFRRFVALSVHATNLYPLTLFARQIYEKHGIPAVYIDPFDPFTEEARALFEGEYARSKEASLVLAALHVLGQPDLYSEDEMRYEDQSPPFPESFRTISRVGYVGRFMQDARQHACPSVYVSLERGLAFIEKQVEAILPALEAMDAYAAEASAQKNQGWWR